MSNPAKKKLIRGSTSIIASLIIALLIRFGIAEPYPILKLAYIASGIIAAWGLIDIAMGVFGARRLK